MPFLHPKSPNILNNLPRIHPPHRIGNHNRHKRREDVDGEYLGRWFLEFTQNDWLGWRDGFHQYGN